MRARGVKAHQKIKKAATEKRGLYSPLFSYNASGDTMNNLNRDPMALTTVVNTLATAIAAGLDDGQLALAAAVLTQMGDVMSTIAVHRGLAANGSRGTGV